ncbi:arylsulfatase [Flammeovirga pacifica]|nr:arylsulfatase [Flammeovirga pacifica]
MMNLFTRTTTLFLVLYSFLSIKSCNEIERPNVIIIVTDDQGYGDIAAHGNKEISTPHIDQLHNESLRLTNFHVNPTCAPTRSALMTGKDANRVGVWHTVMGRSMLYEEEHTMADIFSDNNYATGLFGKWHLGDNYPFSPQYRGFQEVLTHKGGGVGQTPDYWNNDYFDDVYFRNGKEEKVEGYCTDVWFREALSFIKKNKEKRQPFFCYISTNAPHAPLNVPQSYAKPYLDKGLDDNRAKFYGMISNIDDNIGALRERLKEWEIDDNTLIIFMSDNGSAYGASFKGKELISGYNAGMIGTKGSPFEGGHRVPFYVHWKKGHLDSGKDVNHLTAHIDILPTLIQMCGLTKVPDIQFDGMDISEVIRGESENNNRILIGDSQRLEYPKKWRNSYVMMDQWRLINGTELYDLKLDPGQTDNIFDAHPDIVKELHEAYENYWSSISKTFDRYAYIKLGDDIESNSTLTAHDWHVSEQQKVPWNQDFIRKGVEGDGVWKVNFTKTGKYKIALRRWPQESNLQLNESSPAYYSPSSDYSLPKGKMLNFSRAYLTIGGKTWEKRIVPNTQSVVFEVEIQKGKTDLKASFKTHDNILQGAYYVYVEKMSLFKSI